MFGFIKKKIKAFSDAFSEQAEEEVVDPASEELTQEANDIETELESVMPPEAAEPSSGSEPAKTIEPAPSAGFETTVEDSVQDGMEVSVPEPPQENSVPTDEEVALEPSETPLQDQAPAEPKADSSTEQEATLDAPKRGVRERFMGAITKRSLSDDRFESLFADLEIGLLEANTAYDAVQAIKEQLRERITGSRVSRFSASDDVARALKESIAELFEAPEDLVGLAEDHQPLVLMMIGINGSGKTTSAAKLAYAFQKAGKRPVLVAADTFRAAAIQQLESHANALDCRIIKHDYGADPAAVAYDAIAHARSGKADVVIIDTAGRLHSNENLLKELEKVKRIASPDRIIFVGESIAGNDLVEQAQTFNERIGIDGIILTKADVDESGGGALSVSYITKKPIDYFGSGQSYEDLEPFSIDRMAQLLGLE